jgi:hypothetical protein
MNYMFTLVLVLMAGSIVFIIVRRMMKMKGDIDRKLQDIGPVKPGESIETLVEKMMNHDADPARFNDPVAMQTNWSPARPGGSSFKTNTPVRVDASRLEFRVSRFAKAFSLIFIVSGIGIAIGFAIPSMSQGLFVPTMGTVVPLVFGAVFATLGAAMWYWFTTPIVFDKRKGRFWKGRKALQRTYERKAQATSVFLDEIHALQLISEYCQSDKRSYCSHELNLVLKDGRRINVVDHGAVDDIRLSARRLSQFLGKPLWDATTE